MYRKILALFLALMLTLAPLFGGAGTVRAAQLSYEEIEDLVTQQYDAFAKSLNPQGASEAALRLLKHSIKGGGTLNLTAKDKFSAGLLNSGLFRTSFIHAASVAIRRMVNFDETTCFMRGGANWYDKDYYYYYSAYLDDESGNESDDKTVSPDIVARGSYKTPINTYDEGMMLVVGDASTKFIFRKTAATRDSLTFTATIKVYDKFDFTGADYSGSDKGLAETITWIGRFLALGVLRTFSWSVNAEVQITVPNPCVHQTCDYRWEFDGAADLASVTAAPYTANPLTKKGGTFVNGLFSKTYYATARAIALHPDQPWSIEWVSKGTGRIVLAEDSSLWWGGDFLRKTSSYLHFGEYILLNETDEDETLTQYGINTDAAGINSKLQHTYLLENRVEDNGSNMVYLTIDGEEIGPMNQYYHGTTSQGTTSNWLSGKVLRFFYIGKASYPLQNEAIDYLQISEGGENKAPYDLCRVSVKQPTCAEKGKTTYSCFRCGATFSESIPTLEHNAATVPGTLPTCTETGLSEGSKCNSCGKVLVEQAVIEPLGHSFEDHICTVCGDRKYIPGDVDLNETVDVDDVLALLWNVLFPDDYPIEVDADFDGNGTTDVDDVLTLLWHVLFPEDYPLN